MSCKWLKLKWQHITYQPCFILYIGVMIVCQFTHSSVMTAFRVKKEFLPDLLGMLLHHKQQKLLHSEPPPICSSLFIDSPVHWDLPETNSPISWFIFCFVFKSLKKKKHLGKLKYLDAVLLDMILPGVWKAANPRAPLVFLGTDWLSSRDEEDDSKLLLVTLFHR